MNPLVLRCLIYTYCNQKVCITWNGAKSTPFSAINGVKQGGVLSPRLFNVYLNELLSKLRENGLGCHMNGQFVGTFIYADDITILAPSHSSLQSMLTICDQYASKNKNKNIFISINNDIANLYIEENYTNVNIAIMVISIRVMIIKYNIQN